MRKPKRMAKFLVVATLAASVVLPSAPAMAATYTVKAKKVNGNWKWRPAHLFIKKDDRVKWTNPTRRRHNIVAYSSNWSYSKNIAPGEVRRRAFPRRGNFYYRCTLHSAILSDGRCRGQCGIVHVQ